MVPRMWRTFARLRALGPEDGPPALVIPGWVATDKTTLGLRQALAEAGWRVHGWNMGFNRGARPDTVERLRARLDEIRPGGKVLVVGWSLGGVYARELARAAPGKVLALVTLGSPFSGDPRQNNVWRLYEWIAGHKVDAPPIPRIARPPLRWSSVVAIFATRAGLRNVLAPTIRPIRERCVTPAQPASTIQPSSIGPLSDPTIG